MLESKGVPHDNAELHAAAPDHNTVEALRCNHVEDVEDQDCTRDEKHAENHTEVANSWHQEVVGRGSAYRATCDVESKDKGYDLEVAEHF